MIFTDFFKSKAMPVHVLPEHVFEFDIFNDSIKGGDVQLSHMQLHRDAPDVFYTSKNGGHWMVTRHDDVKYVMCTPALFSSVDVGYVKASISLPPQDMDDPEHLRFRLLLMKFLGPKQVAHLETQIHSLMKDLISNVADNKRCEFMADISVPLPVKTFMGMMHMDLSRYAEFVKWANGILGAQSNFVRLAYFYRMTTYLKSLIRGRVKTPGDDPISVLLASEVEGKQLTEKQVLSMCNLLFLAGLDTVTNAMTFITKYLAENPVVQQRLRDNPDKIPAAIEEFMRRFSFVNVPRRVTQDTELKGVKLKKGDIIMSSLAAASADGTNVDSPEVVDLDRPKSIHLGFNTGPHTCAGANLARMELRIFLEEWLKAIPEFRLAKNHKTVVRGGTVMAIESLQLEW